MNTTIKARISAITAKADELDAANKAARELAKASGEKFEPVNAPSVIYKLRRDVDALLLMAYAGLEDKIANEKNEVTRREMEEMLARFTDPATGASVSCKRGDTITSLLVTYKDVKDVAAKLQAFCDKNDLVFDLAGNIIR